MKKISAKIVKSPDSKIVDTKPIDVEPAVSVENLTKSMKDLTISEDDIKTELISLITLHARRDHKKYMYTYSETAPKDDLVVDWTVIVSNISEKFTSNKKNFKISQWKAKMRELAQVDCISKVKWR